MKVNWNYAKLMKKGREGYIKNKKFRIFLKKIIDLKGTERILDIGCGIGTVSRLLIKIYKNLNQIKGIDLDSNLINWGRKHWGKPENIDLMVGDVYNLQFDENEFDVIVSFGLLEWLKEPLKALDEITRVNKNGGKILTLVIEKSTFEKLPKDKNYDNFYNEYLKGVKKFGCRIENEGNYIQGLFSKRGLKTNRNEYVFEYKTKITEGLIEMWEKSMTEENYIEFIKSSVDFYYQFLKKIGWERDEFEGYLKEKLSFKNIMDIYKENIGEEMVQRTKMVIIDLINRK